MQNEMETTISRIEAALREEFSESAVTRRPPIDTSVYFDLSNGHASTCLRVSDSRVAELSGIVNMREVMESDGIMYALAAAMPGKRFFWMAGGTLLPETDEPS